MVSFCHSWSYYLKSSFSCLCSLISTWCVLLMCARASSPLQANYTFPQRGYPKKVATYWERERERESQWKGKCKCKPRRPQKWCSSTFSPSAAFRSFVISLPLSLRENDYSVQGHFSSISLALLNWVSFLGPLLTGTNLQCISVDFM